MSNKIITISREYGSGGRDIGRMAAEKLGIPCYDQELIEKIAEESGYTKDYINERSEAMPYSSWIGNVLSIGNGGGYDPSEILWAAQCKVIRDLAENGPCVIVGRCADQVLDGSADLLKIFVYAPLEERCKRAVVSYGEAETNIEKRVLDMDKRRKAYYQMYTDAEWGVASNYDICMNSGAFGLEKCADAIAELYK